MFLDIEELSEEEFDEVLEFSSKEDNLPSRYVMACHIIASMIETEENAQYNGIVDLSICKMLLDGTIEIKPSNNVLH